MFEERVLKRLSETKSGTVMDEGETWIMRRHVIFTNAMGSGF
jgi:hypothetical protein